MNPDPESHQDSLTDVRVFVLQDVALAEEECDGDAFFVVKPHLLAVVVIFTIITSACSISLPTVDLISRGLLHLLFLLLRDIAHRVEFRVQFVHVLTRKQEVIAPSLDFIVSQVF